MALTGPALLRCADNFAEALGFRLDPDRLIAEAQARSGREFRGREFEPALRVLLEACEREANLSFLGRVCLRWDVLRLLGNVLRVERAEDDDPAITRQGVVAPIFITGLPRSGTTFLHTLLAQDPQNGAPLVLLRLKMLEEAFVEPERRYVTARLQPLQIARHAVDRFEPLAAGSRQHPASGRVAARPSRAALKA